MPWYLSGYRPWLALILLCAALYLPGLGPLPATDRDESRFMQASRQMIETGDLVRIRYMHEARNKKPAGIHWMQAATVSTVSHAAAPARWPYRLPSALGALAGVLLLFAAGQRLFDRKTAFVAAALLAGSFMLVFEAHIAKTDAMLLATVMAAQYALIRLFTADRDGSAVPRWVPVMFWASLGVGILIKGPLTPFVVGLTAIGLWLTGFWPRLWQQLKPLWGVPLMALIAAPWFIAIVLADPDFVRESAGHDFFKKLVSFQENHGAPPGYYLLASLFTFAPGSLFMGVALWWAARRRREREIALCLFWLVPFWLVLEIVPTKLPHYILPAYPALALLIARAAVGVEEGLMLRAQWRWARLGYLAWGAMIVAVAVALVLLVRWAGGTVGWLYALPPVALALVIPVVAKAWRGETRAALTLAAFLSPVIFIAAFHFALPRADAIWPSRTAAQAVARAFPDPATRPPLVATGYREPSLVFMLGTPTRFADPPEMADLLKTLPRWLALVEASQKAAFEASMAQRGIALTAIESFPAFNYSQGRRITLTLYGQKSP